MGSVSWESSIISGLYQGHQHLNDIGVMSPNSHCLMMARLYITGVEKVWMQNGGAEVTVGRTFCLAFSLA
jgi:hypothetical protein